MELLKGADVQRYRVLFYVLVGILFGVLDWYMPDLTMYIVPPTLLNHPIGMLLGLAWLWGVWLLPAIPIALYEIRASQRVWAAALAVILTWLGALTGYYAYYMYLLAFVGLNQMEMFLWSARRDPLFWQAWPSTFRTLMLYQWLEWSPVAVIGGAGVGGTIGWLYQKWQRQHSIGQAHAT